MPKSQRISPLQRTISEANDAYGDDEIGSINIPDGEVLKVDAKIFSGNLVIQVEDEEYIIDKSGELVLSAAPKF